MSIEGYADRIAEIAQERSMQIVVAESLTCGKLASALGAASDASEWFRGGIVAYADEVKFQALGVTPGPVITAECAAQMAVGVLRQLGGDAAVAVTGVGGPAPEEGKTPGTVFIGTALRNLEGTSAKAAEHHFPGPPHAVITATVETALRELRERLS